MMKQEQEAYTLLKYMSKRVDYHASILVINKADNLFYTERLLTIKDPEYRKRDIHSITIDFKEKQIKWSASYQSYHNGSDYNHVNGTVDWNEYIPLALERLKPAVKNLLRDEIKREEQIRIEEKHKKEAERRLAELLEVNDN